MINAALALLLPAAIFIGGVGIAWAPEAIETKAAPFDRPLYLAADVICDAAVVRI